MLWERPAGNLAHGPLVACGTAAALLLGTAAVLRSLFAPAAQAASGGNTRGRRKQA